MKQEFTVTTFQGSEIHTNKVPMPEPEAFPLGSSWLYWPIMGALFAFIVLTAYALIIN